jgi:SAM-dependent methyltransferase
MDFRTRILEKPFLFSIFKAIIGVKRRTRDLIDQYIKPDSSTMILDIGCGRGEFAKDLYPSPYVGIDNNPAYIATAQRKFGKYGKFVVGDVSDAKKYASTNDPTTVLLIGVIHHLSHDQATSLLSDISDLLGAGGRVITVDPVFTPEQSLSARLLAASDRGRYVRSKEETLGLLEQNLEVRIADIRNDWLRIPYTHLVCIAHKR